MGSDGKGREPHPPISRQHLALPMLSTSQALQSLPLLCLHPPSPCVPRLVACCMQDSLCNLLLFNKLDRFTQQKIVADTYERQVRMQGGQDDEGGWSLFACCIKF